jgi:hypothetical protein
LQSLCLYVLAAAKKRLNIFYWIWFKIFYPRFVFFWIITFRNFNYLRNCRDH